MLELLIVSWVFFALWALIVLGLLRLFSGMVADVGRKGGAGNASPLRILITAVYFSLPLAGVFIGYRAAALNPFPATMDKGSGLAFLVIAIAVPLLLSTWIIQQASSRTFKTGGVSDTVADRRRAKIASLSLGFIFLGITLIAFVVAMRTAGYDSSIDATVLLLLGISVVGQMICSKVASASDSATGRTSESNFEAASLLDELCRLSALYGVDSAEWRVASRKSTGKEATPQELSWEIRSWLGNFSPRKPWVPRSAVTNLDANTLTATVAYLYAQSDLSSRYGKVLAPVVEPQCPRVGIGGFGSTILFFLMLILLLMAGFFVFSFDPFTLCLLVFIGYLGGSFESVLFQTMRFMLPRSAAYSQAFEAWQKCGTEPREFEDFVRALLGLDLVLHPSMDREMRLRLTLTNGAFVKFLKEQGVEGDIGDFLRRMSPG